MPKIPPFLESQVFTQFAIPIELALYYGGKSQATWRFEAVPPTSVQYQEPLRANVQQALAMPYVDRYNAALPLIIVAWTTSTGPGAVLAGSSDLDGYTHFMRLVVQMIRGYYTQTASDVTGDWTMHWYDYPHQQYASVVPLVNDWTHATPENLALSTQLQFQVLEWITAPHAPSRTYLQSQLVDKPTQFVQSTAQKLLVAATNLGGYLNPHALTPTEQSLWHTSVFRRTWDIADYQEWLNQESIQSPLTQQILTFATQTIPAIVTPILLTPTTPYQTTLSQIHQAAATATTLLGRVTALSTPTPWVQMFLDQIRNALTVLPVAPQLFTP